MEPGAQTYLSLLYKSTRDQAAIPLLCISCKSSKRDPFLFCAISAPGTLRVSPIPFFLITTFLILIIFHPSLFITIEVGEHVTRTKLHCLCLFQFGANMQSLTFKIPPPFLPCIDTMVAAAAFSGEEPIELSGNHLADINLHAVESISDLHYASSSHAGAKISEGKSSTGLERRLKYSQECSAVKQESEYEWPVWVGCYRVTVGQQWLFHLNPRFLFFCREQSISSQQARESTQHCHQAFHPTRGRCSLSTSI